MRERVLNIVLEQCKDFGKEEQISAFLNPSIDTKIFHSDGYLDSLGLVRFISELEERIDNELHKDIIIADEKAMSRRPSPFISVGTLSDYIYELLQNES